MDVILQNQITILRQNEDIRQRLAVLWQAQCGAGKSSDIKVPKRAEMLLMSPGLLNAAVKCSRAYHARHGDGAMRVRITQSLHEHMLITRQLIRSKGIGMAIARWTRALRENINFSIEHIQELDSLDDDQLVALHTYCASQVRARLSVEVKANGVDKNTDFDDIEIGVPELESPDSMEVETDESWDEDRGKKRQRLE
jgi:hypothetical protein